MEKINLNSIEIVKKAASASTRFEENVSKVKNVYLYSNIFKFNSIASNIEGVSGTFGTGYPFYALDRDFNTKLPVIGEQIRYNNELLEYAEKSNSNTWECTECLSQSSHKISNLKETCNSCNNVDDNLKPRKVINRLPDIDMWMVCNDSEINNVKQMAKLNLYKENMQPSDIDPIKSIIDVLNITEELEKNMIPKDMLPIDAHIIDYDTLYSLIEKVPEVLKQAYKEGETPYLPIHPLSLRKMWQKDDVPYNFVHDYLYALTDFGFPSDLSKLLSSTRNLIANTYTLEKLFEFSTITGSKSVKERNKTLQLSKIFEKRINTWKKI